MTGDVTLDPKYQIAFYVLEYLSPVIGALVVVLVGRAIAWLKSKTKSEELRRILTQVDDLVATHVRESEQTFVKEIKKARAPDSKDGERLTVGEAQNVKKQVLGRLEESIGLRGLASMKKTLGIDDSALRKFLEAKIEAMVYREKKGA